MNRIITLIVAALVCCISFGCGNYDDDIARIDERLSQVSTSIGGLENTDKELKGIITSLEGQAADLSSSIARINKQLDDTSLSDEVRGELASEKSDLVARLEGITADHGNTQCAGIGRLVGVGVDIETKSHRMVVLKAFADKEKMADKFGLIEYPKYYLPKEYEYLICDTGKSLDNPCEQVMTHGGMTIDEVVVPFIKIF